jgi:hypothetical protein
MFLQEVTFVTSNAFHVGVSVASGALVITRFAARFFWVICEVSVFTGSAL